MELGITGHLTRGNEVIEILEMLGGKNCCRLNGDQHNYFYYISNKIIYNSYIGPDEINGYKILSLDDFLEKFPYKVGDKVKIWVNHEHFSGPRAELEEAEIYSMRWNAGRCEVAYRMKVQTGEFYKNDIKGKVDDNNTDHPEKGKYNVEKYLKLFDESEHGLEVYITEGYDIKEIDGHFYIVKQKPTYPKTYEECCKTLNLTKYPPALALNKSMFISQYKDFPHYYEIQKLAELIICRDTYWKIIGEEMGLDKPWNPDFANFNGEQCYYIITTRYGDIIRTTEYTNDEILVFPYSHKEIAIEFYNNFESLIESCKELL